METVQQPPPRTRAYMSGDPAEVAQRLCFTFHYTMDEVELTLPEQQKRLALWIGVGIRALRDWENTVLYGADSLPSEETLNQHREMLVTLMSVGENLRAGFRATEELGPQEKENAERTCQCIEGYLCEFQASFAAWHAGMSEKTAHQILEDAFA